MFPRTKLIVSPEYRSTRIPLNTTQFRVSYLKRTSIRSRFKVSLRVSQPFRSTSAHVCPNSERAYPVFGARPFTAKVANASIADISTIAFTGAACADDIIPPAKTALIRAMASLISQRLISQSLRVASGKTRSNTLIGSDLHSAVKADVCPGLLAQLVEQVTLNHRVGGSSPSQPT